MREWVASAMNSTHGYHLVHSSSRESVCIFKFLLKEDPSLICVCCQKLASQHLDVVVWLLLLVFQFIDIVFLRKKLCIDLLLLYKLTWPILTKKKMTTYCVLVSSRGCSWVAFRWYTNPKSPTSPTGDDWMGFSYVHQEISSRISLVRCSLPKASPRVINEAIFFFPTN